MFLVGVIGVGFLALPVTTAGAPYDLAQSFGCRHRLRAKPREAKAFYAAIVVLTLIAAPVKALAIAGVVQGVTTPPLLIVEMTNNKTIMGEQSNGVGINILAGLTVLVTSAPTLGLIETWLV